MDLNENITPCSILNKAKISNVNHYFLAVLMSPRPMIFSEYTFKKDLGNNT